MKLKNILKSLIFVFVVGIIDTSVQPYNRYANDNQYIPENAIQFSCIDIGQAPQKIEYKINDELSFEPKNIDYYTTISNELHALETRFGNQEAIVLTNNPQSQALTKNLYELLHSKTEKIAKSMGVDMKTISVCIKPITSDVNKAFNAHAQTLKTTKFEVTQKIRTDTGEVLETKTTKETSNLYRLTLNAETIRLFVWHEGDFDYKEKEGLLDGTIAHELGHIFHKHIDSSIECEFEADTTGALNLNNPKNLMSAIDLISLSGHIFACLCAYQNYHSLNIEEIYSTVNIISNNIVNHEKDLGYLGLSPTHTQFSYKIQKAFKNAFERIKSNNHTDKKNIVSIIYDEIKDCCKTPLNAEGEEAQEMFFETDYTLSLYSKLTHPAPLIRRKHLATLCG